MVFALLEEIVAFYMGLTSRNRAFKSLLQGLSYYCAITRAGISVGKGLESKTVLKIYWRSSSKYWVIENKSKTTGGVTTRAEVRACYTAGMLLLLVGVAPASLSLSPRKRF